MLALWSAITWRNLNQWGLLIHYSWHGVFWKSWLYNIFIIFHQTSRSVKFNSQFATFVNMPFNKKDRVLIRNFYRLKGRTRTPYMEVAGRMFKKELERMKSSKAANNIKTRGSVDNWCGWDRRSYDKTGLRAKKSVLVLVLQVWCCVVKHGLVTLVVIMILKDTATFQVLFIVSMFCARSITTVEISVFTYLKVKSAKCLCLHFRWSWSWT